MCVLWIFLSYFQVRLTSGFNVYEGRVEIFLNGTWGTICDDLFNSEAAYVVCKQLGLSGGIAANDLEYGGGFGEIWIDNINCTGEESTILDCEMNPIGDHNCGHHEDVGVICIPV